MTKKNENSVINFITEHQAWILRNILNSKNEKEVQNFIAEYKFLD